MLSTGIHQPEQMSFDGNDENGKPTYAHESCEGLCDTCPCALCEFGREFNQLMPELNKLLAARSGLAPNPN